MKFDFLNIFCTTRFQSRKRERSHHVLASIGHTVKSSLPRNSAAMWVESITAGGFRACVLEYGRGSNKTAQVNWIAFQNVLSGSKFGSIWFNSLTSGTECKKIDFKQVRNTFIYPPFSYSSILHFYKLKVFTPPFCFI